jgi:aminopeptidase-like protein
VLKHSGYPYEIKDFSPYGYDERQFCSPGFNLPVGSLTRTPFGCYPEYHTSADDLDFIQIHALANSLQVYTSVLGVLENNCTYLNKNPFCEPQLGRRGLYGNFGGRKLTKNAEMALLWVLNLSDGTHSLLNVAERSGLSFELIQQAANNLLACDLLTEYSVCGSQPKARSFQDK